MTQEKEAQDNPYPNARHRTTDWDPAGKSEVEEKAIDETFEEGQPLPHPATHNESPDDKKQRAE